MIGAPLRRCHSVLKFLLARVLVYFKVQARSDYTCRPAVVANRPSSSRDSCTLYANWLCPLRSCTPHCTSHLRHQNLRVHLTCSNVTHFNKCYRMRVVPLPNQSDHGMQQFLGLDTLCMSGTTEQQIGIACLPMCSCRLLVLKSFQFTGSSARE